MKWLLVVLALATLAADAPAGDDTSTPSLAERAEQARQKKASRAPAKVLTNKDLRNAKGTVIVLPEPEPTPSPSPAASPAAMPASIGDVAAAAPAPTDPAKVQADVQELSERVARYRKALQDADSEMRAGGDRLSAERRAALTKFLEDGRQEVAAAEKALAELVARQGAATARP